MKVTRDWLERSSPCADGHAFGDLEVGAAGMELADCWPRMKRADWLIWLAVKSGTVTIAWAFAWLPYALKAFTGADGDVQELIDQLEAVNKNAPADLHALRHAAATTAYTALSVQRNEKKAYECEAVALCALAHHTILREKGDRALTLLQGAYNAIGKAAGHEAVSDALRDAVLAIAPAAAGGKQRA